MICKYWCKLLGSKSVTTKSTPEKTSEKTFSSLKEMKSERTEKTIKCLSLSSSKQTNLIIEHGFSSVVRRARLVQFGERTSWTQDGFSLGVDRWWCQKTGRVYFMTELSPEATTSYHNIPGRLRILFMCFVSHCWRLRFMLLFILVLVLEGRSILLQRLIVIPLLLSLISYLLFIQTMFCVSSIPE